MNFSPSSLRPERDYGRMLQLFGAIDLHPADAVRGRHIRENSKALVGKSRSQKLFTQVASTLFNFGIDNDYCATNPATRMKRIGKAKSFAAWSDKQCAAFENSKARAPSADGLHDRTLYWPTTR